MFTLCENDGSEFGRDLAPPSKCLGAVIRLREHPIGGASLLRVGDLGCRYSVPCAVTLRAEILVLDEHESVRSCRFLPLVPTELSSGSLILGPTGAGKTSRLLSPYCQGLIRGSASSLVLVLSKPDRAVAEETIALAARSGYRIVHMRLSGSPAAGVDLLGLFRSLPDGLRALANILGSVPSCGDADTRFFQLAASSLIWEALCSPLVSSISDVAELLTSMEVQRAVLAGAGPSEWRELRQLVNGLESSNVNAQTLATQISSTFSTLLGSVASQRAIGHANAIDLLSLLDSESRTLLVIEGGVESSAALDVLLQALTAAITSVAGARPDGCLPAPWLIAIDDAAMLSAACGHTLAKFANVSRSMGVGQMALVQSKSALENSWGVATANTYLSALQTVFCFSGVDRDTASWVSGRRGTYRYKTTTSWMRTPAGLTDSITTRIDTLGSRPLISTDDLSHPPGEKGPLIWVLLADGTTTAGFFPPVYPSPVPRSTESESEGADEASCERSTPPSLLERLANREAVRDGSANGGSANHAPMRFTNTEGMSDGEILERVAKIKNALGWQTIKNTELAGWWNTIETDNRPSTVLRLAEELAFRNPPATIDEFYHAFCCSGSDGMIANLLYLDFWRARQKHKQRKSGESSPPMEG